LSLINDALRRARHEALRQEAEKGRPGYGAVPAHSRRTSRPWLLFVGGALAAVVVLGAAITFWPQAGGAESTALPAVRQAGEEASGVAVASDAGAPDADAPGAVATIRSDEEGTGEVQAEAALPKPPPEVPLEVALPVSVEPQAAAVPGPVAQGPAVRRQPAVQSPRLESGATYLRRATAADGSTVELGGIVYSDARPIAMINGSVVTPGDMIDRRRTHLPVAALEGSTGRVEALRQ